MRRASLTDPEFAIDPDDPDGYRAGMARFGPGFGAKQTGASLYELPPGQALCPYHYEYAEEEWLLVIEGRPSVRTPQGTEQLEPLELAFFPTGPDGAHKVFNDTDAPVRFLMWSTVVAIAATAYPDSGKVGVYTDVPGEERLLVRRADAVDYYDGEDSG